MTRDLCSFPAAILAPLRFEETNKTFPEVQNLDVNLFEEPIVSSMEFSSSKYQALENRANEPARSLSLLMSLTEH